MSFWLKRVEEVLFRVYEDAKEQIAFGFETAAEFASESEYPLAAVGICYELELNHCRGYEGHDVRSG